MSKNFYEVCVLLDVGLFFVSLATLSFPASGTIWLDDLSCVGTETRLSACRHPGWGVENCGHAEDVGLICNNDTIGKNFSSIPVTCI